MNKTKEIEDMARILEFCAHKDCESCRRNGNYRCSAYNKATDLANTGYGNVKQAVQEFAETLRKKAKLLYEPNREWYENVRVNEIDDLIVELYGADE